MANVKGTQQVAVRPCRGMLGRPILAPFLRRKTMVQDADNVNDAGELTEHPSLRVLIPYLREYLRKGLETHRSGGVKFRATYKEQYSADVFDRISELDISLTGLRLTSRFMHELADQLRPDMNVYRYHYENFMLRAIGFDDRAHRLVGSALMMDRKKIETVNGKNHVRSQVLATRLDVNSSLDNVAQAVKRYRKPRNELIHNAAFSSREFGLLHGIRRLRMDTDGIDVDSIAREYSSAGADEVDLTVSQLQGALVNLLDVLAPSFSSVAALND